MDLKWTLSKGNDLMKKNNENMLLSVITVCYNTEKSITNTIQSVLNQSYKDIEYIIVDGNSTDNTFNIVKKYQENNDNIIALSESDEGIYDAMNKGLSLTQGEYVFFLNSGDAFLKNDTVKEVANILIKERPVLLYGDINYVYKNRIEYRNYTSQNLLSRYWMALGITVCHQAIWVQSSVIKKRKFDLSYKIWADQELLAYCLKYFKKISKYHEAMCNFDAYGFSYGEERKEMSRLECDRISKKYTPIYYRILYPFKYWVRKIEKRKKD